MSVLLSVITINYNNKTGLQDTLSYLDNHTLPDIVEWLVIDGGSSDGSIGVIENYSSKLSLYISEPDNGIYHAMNKGTALAKGEYVIFMNSGDRFTDGLLEQTLLQATLHSDDIIYGDCFETSKGKEPVLSKGKPSFTFLDLVKGCICHQAAFISRAHQLKVPYDENMKLASTRRFFLESAVFEDAGFRYTEWPVAIYDTTGVSYTRRSELVRELDMYLAMKLPRLLKADLDRYMQIDNIIRNSSLFQVLFSVNDFSGKKRLFESVVKFIHRIMFRIF